MPETGFSLDRLREHLRKWIGLYLAATVALCFLNNLVYTVSRPGFSDDERLKIMLLNMESSLSDDEYAQLSMNLLPAVQAVAPTVQILEFESLPGASAGDMQGEMLLNMKITGGFGDLYLTDEAGRELLAAKGAIIERETLLIEGCILNGQGAYLTVMANGTDVEGAISAAAVLAEGLKE